MSAPSNARVLPVTLLGSEPIAPEFMLCTMSCPDLARAIQPGQFFNLAVPGDQRELLRIPMSYSESRPREGIVAFAYRVVGEGTRRLASLPSGVRTDLIGPAGNGWSYPDGMKKALLVGGGSGIAPILALARRLSETGVEFQLVQGARTSREVLFESDFLACGATRFEVTTDDGTRGIKGFPTAVVGDMISREGYDQAYVCGPTPLMKGVAAIAHDLHLPCQVSLETGMACGFGACATCAVDTVGGKKGVCVDGPVFDAEEVIW